MAKRRSLRALGLNPRALKVNARSLGVNPRALGVNPRITAPHRIEDLAGLKLAVAEAVRPYLREP